MTAKKTATKPAVKKAAPKKAVAKPAVKKAAPKKVAAPEVPKVEVVKAEREQMVLYTIRLEPSAISKICGIAEQRSASGSKVTHAQVAREFIHAGLR